MTKRLIPISGQAKGEFDVQMHPIPLEDIPGDALMARMSIDKQFRGELDGTSKGQMLSAGTPANGSAAYVAVERVTGSLQGRTGSFSLYHTGVMNAGQSSLTIGVVPDSGTDALTGLAGAMTIDIKDGAHFYTLDYTLG